MQIRFIDSIHEVKSHLWNRLCPADYPFVRHEFLAALEDSHCLAPNSGWQARHLLVEKEGELIAAMPGYLKTHSYGEYVFDWSWADAYRRYGLDYYPKWINAIPFTPCQGERLLLTARHQSTELLAYIAAALNNACVAQRYSSWHCLFSDQTISEQLHTLDAMQRIGCQFHWFNRDYEDFENFVATMSARKRKNILKERRQVREQGFAFHIKTGGQLTPTDWMTFYALYRTTYLKRSGHKGYLTAEFFRQLGATMGENLVLISASKIDDADQHVIAAALFVRDSTTLYGRYWGCFEEYQFLHFETCYYQGIDYAIASKLQRFDGGAQGEHKIARGFEPVLTYSNHWIKEPDFRTAIEQFLQNESVQIRHYAEQARLLLPFK